MGTRPGNPLADFNVFSRWKCALTIELRNAELAPRMWASGQAVLQAGGEPEAVQLVAFMGDLVNYLEGDRLEVLRKVSHAAAMCRKVCAVCAPT